MPVLDTSFLVALLNGDDLHHAEARSNALRLPLVVPGPVLVELLQVVQHRTRRLHGDSAGRQAARSAFTALEANPAFHLQADYDGQLASAIYRKASGLSYVDAVAVAVAHRAGEPLLSFDKEQLAALAAERSS
ncbi:MAG TPA: PIN domain-containing protein [Candidatus Thermoplasmatota archaeon]|nr:PIN domain-containing protein [Candidatus Thermoplasmatota archaeon]